MNIRHHIDVDEERSTVARLPEKPWGLARVIPVAVTSVTRPRLTCRCCTVTLRPSVEEASASTNGMNQSQFQKKISNATNAARMMPKIPARASGACAQASDRFQLKIPMRGLVQRHAQT